MAKDKDSLSEQEEWELSSIRQRPTKLNAKSVGSIVRRLMSQRGYGQTQHASALVEHWTACAGAHLSECCRPTRIHRGVLQVLASNSVALQELNFEKRKILSRLKERAPELNIQDIRARVGD